MDKEIKASGFVKEQLGDDLQVFDNIHELILNKDEAEGEDQASGDDDKED